MSDDDVPPIPRLEDAEVTRFADLALAGITREYPNKPGHVLAGDADLVSPRTLHPAFHGCFDWHSAVHGHWMLVRLLRLHPDWRARRIEVVEALSANLAAGNIQVEADYFEREHARAFERPYGWAWLLRLAQELRAWDDDRARGWAAHLAPLEARIVELARAWLPTLRGPLRSGQHGDGAFALGFFLDHARATGDEAFEALCIERARTWYMGDRRYPLAYEPSAHDFFSAGLNVADVMRRVLAPDAFAAWLDAFVPTLREGSLGPWAEPVTVRDVTDGHAVHLAGLDLTRAWTMRAIAEVLPTVHPGGARLARLADAHEKEGLGYVFSGDYAGDHWLGSFAVYLVTRAWDGR